MKVAVSIIGKGSVDGQGEYGSGSSVSLSAKALSIYTFSHFLVDGDTIKSNPYVFTVGDYDSSVTASFIITMETYLEMKVGFDVDDGVIEAILADRGVGYDVDSSSIDDDPKQLCYADLLMWGATMPSSVGGAKESDFGWSKQESTKTMSITDKREMRKIAMSIYRKLDPDKYASNLRLVNLTGLFP